jgi:hypothetical protein
MKVTHTTTGKGFNRNHRKEKHFYKELLVITPALKQVITCRFYGTQAMSYCCIWVNGGTYSSGSGSAGGYGYHRASAAAAEAITAAGYTLERSIAGSGDSAIEEALINMARVEGYPEAKIFSAHA